MPNPKRIWIGGVTAMLVALLAPSVCAAVLAAPTTPDLPLTPPAKVAASGARLDVFPPDVNLETARDRQSIVATLVTADGVTRDVTAEVKIALSDPTLAVIQGNVLSPKNDGKGEIRVSHGGFTKVLPLKVGGAKADRPISFNLDVMPVFMSAGCNTGGCHGSARGKDGFRLSLFGYDPEGDYHRLTREMPTRRLNLVEPAGSLVLTKGTGAVPHTGGKRFEEKSAHYATLLRWIEAGAPKDDAATVAHPVAVELYPSEMLLEGEGAKQQLIVRARYSDGTDRDVTDLAVFLSNNDNSAIVSAAGLITAAKRGEAFVMARFATFTVGSPAIVIPKGIKYAPLTTPENNYIDTLVNAKLRKMRVEPSGLCSDEVFIRRAYVDIVGTLPTPAEQAKFVAAADPKKREKLVDELLGRKEFVEMWVMKFAELLQIRSGNDTMSYKAALLYYQWLQDKLARNVPMDQWVRDLLASTGGTFKSPPTNYFQITTDALKVAENTAQVFMGVRTQCAQCHNHPFDRWTMDDYYGFAAFFSQVARKTGDDPRETIVFTGGGGEVKHPLGDRVVVPRYLGAETPDLKGKDRRAALAAWLTSKENPYFAPNTANIVWSHFFGRGIVEPVDDVRVSNPPSNGELLAALGKQFQAYDYDFRRLVRDICTSRTYQLETRTNPTNESDERNFSHAAIRRTRAEVLLDCIGQVTETKEKFKGLPLGARAVQIADGQTTNYFLTTFGRATRETVCSCEVVMQPSLSQALHLLNGDTVHARVQNGGVVKRLFQDQKLGVDQVLTELYVRCYSRKPSPAELAKVKALLPQPADGKPVLAEEQVKALNDVFWAMLNSREFLFNH